MVFGGSLFNFLTCTSKPVGISMLSMYSSDLKSYTSACETDPNLKSFDSSLGEQTKGVISLLSSGGNKTESLSIDSHLKVYAFLFQVNKDTVSFITQNKEDVWKNKELTSLVDAYFKNTQTILEFCNTVQNCVSKAKIKKLMIQFAVEQFDTEENHDVSQKKKYVKTLEALNKFIAMEDPFNGEFCKKYKSVYDEQTLLLKELHKQKNKVDKKLKNIQTWKILSNAVFVTALVSVLVLSLVAVEDESPGIVLNMTALREPIANTGKWCSDMCKEYEKVLKRQKVDVESIEKGVRLMNVPMENMRVKAQDLKTKIEDILETAKIAVEIEDEKMVSLVMQRIKEDTDGFTLKIEQVGEAAVTCSDSIASARLDVSKHINKS